MDLRFGPGNQTRSEGSRSGAVRLHLLGWRNEQQKAEGLSDVAFLNGFPLQL